MTKERARELAERFVILQDGYDYYNCYPVSVVIAEVHKVESDILNNNVWRILDYLIADIEDYDDEEAKELYNIIKEETK